MVRAARALLAGGVVGHVSHHVDTSLGPENMIGHVHGAAVLLPAAAERFDAVGVFVDDGHVVEDVPVLRGRAGLPTARAAAGDRVLVAHRPSRLIEAVDVLLDVEVTGEPGEIEPVADLPLHVAPGRLPRVHPQTVGVVAGLHGDDIADDPVMKLRERGAFGRIVAVAQSGNDRQPFGLRLLAGLDDRAHSAGVDGHRLFGEDVLSRGNGGLQLSRPKMGWRAQQHDVTRLDHVLIRVESYEPPLRREVDSSSRRPMLQPIVRGFDLVGKCVPEGYQVHVRVSGQRLLRGPSPPSAATDESDTDDVAAASIGAGIELAQRAEQRTAHEDCCSGLEKVTSTGRIGLRAGS